MKVGNIVNLNSKAYPTYKGVDMYVSKRYLCGSCVKVNLIRLSDWTGVDVAASESEVELSSTTLYALTYRNQEEQKKPTHYLCRETKNFLFLKQIGSLGQYSVKVGKKSLNTWFVDENGYAFTCGGQLLSFKKIYQIVETETAIGFEIEVSGFGKY